MSAARPSRSSSATSSARRRSASERPRGAAGAAGPLLRADEGDRRAARRLGGEVHRRCGHGGVRRAGRARGRRAAGPAGGGGDARRVAELEVQGRIGVNTGEIVTGTQERHATGDAVNVAARLQQAAEPDEVLIGAPTRALVARRGRGGGGRAARAERQGRAGGGVPPGRGARRARARARPAVRRTRARGRAPRRGVEARGRPRSAASSSRWSARPASASRAWSPRRSQGSRRGSCAAAASRTARASRTGPSSR